MNKLLFFPAALVSALVLSSACRKDAPPPPNETTNAQESNAAPAPLEALRTADAGKIDQDPKPTVQQDVPVGYRNAKTIAVDPKDDAMRDGGVRLNNATEKRGSSFESSGGSSGEGTPSHQDVPGQKIWSTK